MFLDFGDEVGVGTDRLAADAGDHIVFDEAGFGGGSVRVDRADQHAAVVRLQVEVRGEGVGNGGGADAEVGGGGGLASGWPAAGASGAAGLPPVGRRAGRRRRVVLRRLDGEDRGGEQGGEPEG